MCTRHKLTGLPVAVERIPGGGLEGRAQAFRCYLPPTHLYKMSYIQILKESTVKIRGSVWHTVHLHPSSFCKYVPKSHVRPGTYTMVVREN